MSLKKFDAETFQQRYARLLDGWNLLKKKSNSPADAIAIISGEYDETDPAFTLTNCFQLWLLGFQLTKTLLLFTERGLVVACSPPVGKLFKDLEKECSVSITVLSTKPNPDTAFAKALSYLKNSYKGKITLSLSEEIQKGAFADAWKAATEGDAISVQKATPLLSFVMANVDEYQSKNFKNGGVIASTVMTKILKQRLSEGCKEKNYTHKEVSDYCLEFFLNPKKISKKLMEEILDATHAPVIQSGPIQLLNDLAPSQETPIDFNCVTTLIGCRFKGYCCEVGRTFFSQPTAKQKENYEILLKVYNAALDALKPKVELSSVYKAAMEVLPENSPLKEYLIDSLGSPLNTLLSDPRFEIRKDNDRKSPAAAVYHLRVAFENIPKEGDQKGYSLFIANTVEVTSSGTIVHTAKSPLDLSTVTLSAKRPLEGGDENESEPKIAKTE